MTTPSIPTPPDAAQVAAASVSAAANSSAIRTPWREFWRKFKKQHVAMAALAFVLLLVINLLQAWQRRHAGAPA